MEVMYDLMSYGLPVKSFPVNAKGKHNKKEHLNWIWSRQKIEEDTTTAKERRPEIIIPGRLDVIFGRGKPLQQHIGNIRLYHMIDENLDRYIQRSMQQSCDL